MNTNGSYGLAPRATAPVLLKVDDAIPSFDHFLAIVVFRFRDLAAVPLFGDDPVLQIDRSAQVAVKL